MGILIDFYFNKNANPINIFIDGICFTLPASLSEPLSIAGNIASVEIAVLPLLFFPPHQTFQLK